MHHATTIKMMHHAPTIRVKALFRRSHFIHLGCLKTQTFGVPKFDFCFLKPYSIKVGDGGEGGYKVDMGGTSCKDNRMVDYWRSYRKVFKKFLLNYMLREKVLEKSLLNYLSREKVWKKLKVNCFSLKKSLKTLMFNYFPEK